MDFLYIDVCFRAIARRMLLILGCVLVVAHSIPSLAENHLLDEINQLDSEFRKVSANFYKTSASTSTDKRSRFSNISKLHTRIKELTGNANDVSAIQLLYKNKSLVFDNVDDRAVFTFIELLLRNNEGYMAEELFKAIKDEGDKSLLATANFMFAQYYADRHEWQNADDLLNGIFSELPGDDSAYAYLLKGVALQNLKRHRKAINYYKKVPVSSRYYREAQLNIAVASIRQGWWTDANLIIKKVTQKTFEDASHNETINRLHLVLGYALLQREYYRNARDEFRKITLDSRYANRALLGIGLTAANQEDFVGGLNALTILKEKNTYDLSVDESYLLLPYVYDKLKQSMMVSASYTEAMTHYNNRIRSLNEIVARRTPFTSRQYDDTTSTLIIGDNRLDYGQAYPESFIKNYRLLLQLSEVVKTGPISKRLTELLGKYDKTYQKIVSALVDERISYLKSYLNQSRYGLAKFFDNSRDNTPGTTADAPNNTSDAPGTTADVPTNIDDMPGTTVDAPNNTDDMPGTTVDVPNNTDDTPGTTVDVPNNTDDVPGTTVDVSTNIDDMPGSAADTSNNAGDMPDTTAEAPDRAGDSPDTTADIPDSTGDTSDTTVDMPNSVDGVPADTSDNTDSPIIVGDVPASASNAQAPTEDTQVNAGNE